MNRLTEKVVCDLPEEVLIALGIADVPRESYEIKGHVGETCADICERHLCNDCPIQRIITKLGQQEADDGEGTEQMEKTCENCVCDGGSNMEWPCINCVNNVRDHFKRKE